MLAVIGTVGPFLSPFILVSERERERGRERERERERDLGIILRPASVRKSHFLVCHTWLCFANGTCIPSHAAISVYQFY